MRPRTTGISATARQQQQQPPQNFKPKSEWKHENEASFLFVYLPGFAVEQLTTTPDYSNRTVKVAGQRRLPNNRVLPVDETFDIPEDCDLSKMDKQFGRGILMLKMPRIIVIPQLAPQQETTKETEEESPKSQEPVNDSKTTDLPKETFTTGVEKQSPDISSQVATTLEEKNDGNVKEIKPEGPESPVQNAGVKEEESKAQIKETDMMTSTMSVAAPKDEEKESKKSPKSANTKGNEVDKEDANGSGTVKKGMVKGLNEDRKLIVNMGAAVLIIMGLGASLFYTMGHKLPG